MDNIRHDKDDAKAVQDDKVLHGTGNLKHIFKTGLPPGVEREDIDDPGMKSLREVRRREAAGWDDGDDEENKDRS